MKLRPLFSTILLVLALTHSAFAHMGNSECLRKYLNAAIDPGTAYNAFLKEKYPELKLVVEDPDHFIKTMRERFKVQLEKEPSAAYRFDYSEIGMPLVKDIDKNIDKKIIELQGEIGSKLPKDEVQIALQYLNDLKKEAQGILTRGKVNYEELVESSYFYSRAIGHFDTRFYKYTTRNFLKIDRYIDGYKQYSIQNEYDLYRKREFKIFHEESGIKGFTTASKKFEEAFKDQKELKTIWVPTNAELERDIFMRMMFKDIHFVGVTYDPILADGFLRPGGDFWVHDARHEAAKHYEKWKYLGEKQLSPAKAAIFDKAVDRWIVDLNQAITKVKDDDLREALDLLTFNYHHDRGFPIIPSVYLARKKDGVVYGLYTMMKVSGQIPGIKNPIYNIEKADKWLRKFWNNRLADEEKVLRELGQN